MTPLAMPRRSGGRRAESSFEAQAKAALSPMPRTRRRAISTLKPLATPKAAVASDQIATPMPRVRNGPIRSASHPDSSWQGV